MTLLVKICGLSTPETIAAALDAGADMIGLNFHPKSPRFVVPDQAGLLAAHARRLRPDVRIVALVVDAEDGSLLALRRAMEPDLWQAHGSEPAERILSLRASLGRPVMKALGVAVPADLDPVPGYAAVADQILLDAKPPKDAAYPGGHGRPFDWAILKALDPATPFLLAGGLTPDNVADAIRTVRDMGLNLRGVDTASGVESAPGLKDIGKIRAFIAAARGADAG